MEYGLIFHGTRTGKYYCKNMKYRINIYILEKWFPLWGERAHSLKLFCMYDKRFEINKKQNRMEEETEPQTLQFTQG